MKPMSLVMLAGALPLLSCSSVPPGPVVPTPPQVEVSQLRSTLITPDGIDFVGKVKIVNRMRGPLELAKVDYAADLHDKVLLEESFAELRPMRSLGTQTVTLRFHVAMQDLTAQLVDVLAEEAVRFSMRGTVFPVGFEPIPFSAACSIPMPRLPRVALDGVRGDPLDGEFTVFVRVENGNGFPLTFGSVETHLVLNDRRYALVRSESFERLEPHGSGRLALTMRQARGKGLSMLVNVIKNGAVDFSVGGALSCGTPYGVFHLPVELSSSSPASPSR